MCSEKMVGFEGNIITVLKRNAQKLLGRITVRADHGSDAGSHPALPTGSSHVLRLSQRTRGEDYIGAGSGLGCSTCHPALCCWLGKAVEGGTRV